MRIKKGILGKKYFLENENHSQFGPYEDIVFVVSLNQYKVKNHNKWGVIAEDGKNLPCEYEEIEPVSNGYVLCKNGLYGYVDSSFRQVVPHKYGRVLIDMLTELLSKKLTFEKYLERAFDPQMINALERLIKNLIDYYNETVDKEDIGEKLKIKRAEEIAEQIAKRKEYLKTLSMQKQTKTETKKSSQMGE